MSWDNNGIIKPYSQWTGKVKLNEITEDFFFGSGGGTYFPVGSLVGANQPIEEIMKICPTADDIWLNAVTRMNGFRTCLVRYFCSVPEWKIKGNKTLDSTNNGQKQNDVQLQHVCQYMQDTFGVDPFTKNNNPI